MVTISGDAIKTATVTKANDIPEGPLFSFASEVSSSDRPGRRSDTVNIVSDEEVSNVQHLPSPGCPPISA